MLCHQSDERLQHRDVGNVPLAAERLEALEQIGAEHRVEDQTRASAEIFEHDVECPPAPHHWPQVLDHFHILELDRASAGDRPYGLAGGIRDQIDVAFVLHRGVSKAEEQACI